MQVTSLYRNRLLKGEVLVKSILFSGCAIMINAIPRSLAIVAVSAFFATFVTTFDSMYVVDRSNYIVHFYSADIILSSYWSGGIVSFLANEPLWRLMNYALLHLFGDAEVAIKSYVFVSAFIAAYCIISYDLRFFVLLVGFLLLPQFLKNYIAHLRQGVAISVFLMAWLGMSGKKGGGVALLTPFIHSSFFFVLLVILVQKTFYFMNISVGLRFIFFFLAMVGFSMFSLVVAQQLGARQSQYELFEVAGTGKAFVFWLVIFFLYVSQGSEFLERHMPAMGILGFYLATYFFLPVAARIFESGLILILLASLSLTRERLLLFYYLFMFYFIFDWYPRIGLEGFGWIR